MGCLAAASSAFMYYMPRSNHPTPQHTQVEIIRNASDNCPPPSQWGQVSVHTQAWLWFSQFFTSTFQLPHCSMGIKAPPSQGYFDINESTGKFLAQSLIKGNQFLFPRKPPVLIIYITIVTVLPPHETPFSSVHQRHGKGKDGRGMQANHIPHL